MLLEYIFFIAIILLTLLAHKLTGFFSLRYPTIPGFYFIWFLLMSTTLLQPSEWEKHVNAPGYQNFMLSIFLHAFFLLLGIVLAYNRNFYKSNVISQNVSLRFSLLGEKKIINIICFIAICLFIHILLSVQKIPIIEIINSGSDDSLMADATINKEALFKGDIGLKNYIWNFNRQIFFPIIVIFFFSKFYLNKTKKNLGIFVFYFILAVLNNSVSGSLAPVALLFFMIGICFVYLSKKIKPSHYVVVIICSLSFPIFVDYVASGKDFGESAQITVDKTVYRFSGETFSRSLDYYNAFGVNEQFLGGRTHKIFTYFSGEEYFNVANYMFLKNLPDRKLVYASTGHQNAHYICYLYADFGFMGVIISSLLIGLFLGKVQLFCSRIIKDKLSFAAYVILITLFWKLMGVHPFTIVFSHGALILILLIYYLNKKLRFVKTAIT